jgi:hypothetical protein
MKKYLKDVDDTGSGAYPVADFRIGGVAYSCSSSIVLRGPLTRQYEISFLVSIRIIYNFDTVIRHQVRMKVGYETEDIFLPQ